MVVNGYPWLPANQTLLIPKTNGNRVVFRRASHTDGTQYKHRRNTLQHSFCDIVCFYYVVIVVIPRADLREKYCRGDDYFIVKYVKQADSAS